MANKIELRGVLDRSFGARWCLRGFASIGDLAKLSQADFDYQRKPNEKHVSELVDFYTKNFDNLFFPELTLCLSLDVIVKARKRWFGLVLGDNAGVKRV